MDLARQLRERRERLALSQERVARSLGVPRELVSYWETGTRVPSLRQLQDLASLYRTSAARLTGAVSDEEEVRRVILRGIEDPEAQRAISSWLGFLDAWADLLGDLGRRLPGPGKPPRQLDERETVTDVRRASTLAEKVRDHYDLGHDAIPDLYAFLDAQRYLVVKANLGSIGRGQGGVSGAFYNHPRLGFCVLVNADTSPGRQAFTLAHELAHALYHHASGGIVCRYLPDDPQERFADAFAASFLVPGKELRRLVKLEQSRSGSETLAPIDAVKLAKYFGVSYAMILVRLRVERLITPSSYEEWRGYSATALATQLGLDPSDFHIPVPRPLRLDRYPVSVLEVVRKAVEEDRLSPKQAAGLLDVALNDVQRTLLSAPPPADERERQEHEQFMLA